MWSKQVTLIRSTQTFNVTQKWKQNTDVIDSQHRYIGSTFETGLPQIESLKRKRNGYDFTRKSSHSKNLEQTKRQHRTKENANTAKIIVCLKSNCIPQS